MLINREVAGGNGERSEPYAAGGLRFGALRAVLRHYSRIINKKFTEFFHFFSNKNIPSYFLDVILCNSHNKYICFHFGRGVQDPLSGDQGGPWTPGPPPWIRPRILLNS